MEILKRNGEVLDTAHSMAWATDLDTARYYVSGLLPGRPNGGVIVTAVVEPQHMLAFVNDTAPTTEMIIDPAALNPSTVTVYEDPAKLPKRMTPNERAAVEVLQRLGDPNTFSHLLKQPPGKGITQ